MGRPDAWKKTTSKLDVPKRTRDFKKALHRANRRKAKQNPESRDKPLDSRAID